jgi:hypothetical protein
MKSFKGRVMIDKSELAELIQSYANTKSDNTRVTLAGELNKLYCCPNSDILEESACRDRFSCDKPCGDMCISNVNRMNAAIEEYNRKAKMFDDAMKMAKE